MQTKSSVGSDHPQRLKSSCQVFSQHPHLVLNQPQQTQQVPVNKSQPSLTSHQQLKNTNLAATSIAQNQQSNQSNTHQQQLSRQSNFPSLQPCQQLCAKQCGNSSLLQTKDAMERQTQQTAPALVPTQGQQSEPKLPQRQLISQSQQKQMQQPPNPSQVVMGNFQTSGMLKHVIGQEIIVQIQYKKEKISIQTFHQLFYSVISSCIFLCILMFFFRSLVMTVCYTKYITVSELHLH